MRRALALLLLTGLLTGCQNQQSAAQPVVAQPVAAPSPNARELPPDIRTRKTGSDWPAFLGPTADSKSTETGILTAWPADGPPIKWQRTVGIGYGMPSISRGRLFHFERQDNEAVLRCLNAETGAELWKFAYPTDYEDQYGYESGPRCCPVVDGDRVYTYGAEGMLHCVRAVDGQVVWKFDTVKTFGVVQNFFGVGSAPVVEGDLLICMVGGSPKNSGFRPAIDTEGNGTGIVAFDKYTGEVKYKITNELASYATPVMATIGGRRWGFAFCRGGLVGFEPAAGTVDFQFPWRARILESVNASNPVIVDDQVLISETYGPGAALLKVKSGGYDIVWQDDARKRDKALQTHWNTPIHHAGFVYGSSGRHTENAELRCVDWKTGEVKWSQPDLTRCSLLMIDGHFVCLGEHGQIHLIKVNPEKFEIVARAWPRKKGPAAPPGLLPEALLGYPAWAAPIVSNGLLYLRGDRMLVCMELIPEKK